MSAEITIGRKAPAKAQCAMEAKRRDAGRAVDEHGRITADETAVDGYRIRRSRRAPAAARRVAS